MISIYSISLGCPKNRVDTEKTLGGLAQRCAGAHMVEEPEEADLVFINTCGFIAPASEESVRTLLETIERLSAMPERVRPLLVAAGCLVGRFGAGKIAPDLPEVDVFLESRDLPAWSEILYEAIARRQNLGPAAPESGHARMLSTGPSYAWLKISEGCRHNCSFCTIPSIRGPLSSIPAAIIREEARELITKGIKELILVAQDVTAWGSDTGEKAGLRALLPHLLPLGGLERLRIMYLYPSGLSPDLLQFLKDAGPPFVPYFDVPLQHAAEGVLSRMGRPFAHNPYKVVDRIRSYFPAAALRTSIITGFPGETEKDFEELCGFIAATRFLHLGVFAYQAEEGTPAAAMSGQIPDGEKERRRDILMRIQSEISEELLSGFEGQRLSILVDSPHEEWPGLHVGRAWFQAPEIDGVTYISGPGVRPGAMVEADITEASTYDLVGLTDAGEE